MKGAVSKAGMRFLATLFLRQRGRGRANWLGLLLLTNMLLCFGLVVLYIVRNRPFG
jgi:hypothetical protein